MSLKTFSESIWKSIRTQTINVTTEDIHKILVEGFKASFMFDEARQVKFRIQIRCNSHNLCSNLEFYHDHFFLKLDLELSANELRRLSQAVEFTQSSIVVGVEDYKLKIVGLYSSGSDWPKFLLFEEQTAFLPSKTLSFSFNKPGACCVHFGISKLAEVTLPDTEIVEKASYTNKNLLDSDAYCTFKKQFSETSNELSENCFQTFLSSLVIRSMRFTSLTVGVFNFAGAGLF